MNVLKFQLMKFTTVFSLLLMCLLCLQACKQDSCASKSGFLEHFDGFASEFEKKQGELDDATKLDYENRYKDIVNNCYKKFKADLTLEEKQDFWKKSLAFYVKRYEGQFSTELMKNIDDPFNQYLKEEVVELVKESGMTFIFSLQSIVKDELPKLMELFSSEIEKFGKELFGAPQD